MRCGGGGGGGVGFGYQTKFFTELNLSVIGSFLHEKKCGAQICA